MIVLLLSYSVNSLQVQAQTNKPIASSTGKILQSDTNKVSVPISFIKDANAKLIERVYLLEINKQQDSIIKFQEGQKTDLLKANDLMVNANKNLEFINDNKTKQIRKEKLKKNFWKATAVGVGLYAIKLIIFKK